MILAIDTSTEIASVAIQTPMGKILEAAHTQSTHHSQAILPLIEQIISQANMALSDIQYVAVSIGPGSFTGVRAGIAVAQGLAYGLNIPVIPIGTLDLVALGLPHIGQIQVIMDARMQQFYVAGFNWDADTVTLMTTQVACLLSESELWLYLSTLSKSVLSQSILVGTGVLLIQDKLTLLNALSALQLNTDGKLNSPQAKNLIHYVNTKLKTTSSLGIPAIDLKPLYIRDQVC